MNSLRLLKKIQMPLKLLHKIKREGTLPNSFDKARINLVPNLRQGHKRKRKL
jgi:hypothetical protein